MHIATIHNDIEDVDPDVGSLTKPLLKRMSLFDRRITANRIGTNIQHKISEESSDCLEDRYWVTVVHKTAAPVDATTGLTILNCDFHILGLMVSKSTRYLMWRKSLEPSRR